MRVGVIGLGVMGLNHARVYRDIGAELVAVCDQDAERASSAARRFSAQAETDPTRLLARGDIEAVSIATPTATHAELARKAFAAGKHVLVEKPIALDVPSARSLVDEARRAKRVLAVGHIERFNPAVRAAKDLVGRGEIGTIHTAYARRINPPNVSGRVRDVGVVHDLAIHDIDVLRYLIGAEPELVYAQAARSQPSATDEDRTLIHLAFPGGAAGLVEASRMTQLRVRTATLTGSEGSLAIDYLEQALEVLRSRLLPYDEAQSFQLPLEFDRRTFRIQKQEPLANELRDFLAAVQGATAPLVTGEDGVANLAVAEAALRSIRERRPVPFREVLVAK